MFLKNKSPIILSFLALTLGFTPQIRPNLVIFTVLLAIIVFTAILKSSFPALKKTVLALMLFVYFLLPFSYTVAANFLYFKTPSILTVDNLIVREFFISLYITKLPSHNYDSAILPIPVFDIYAVYSTVPKNGKERSQMAKYYLGLGIEKIKSDPITFIKTRFQKMYGVWEKTAFFFYEEPNSPFILPAAYLINSLYLILALIGLTSLIRLRHSGLPAGWHGLSRIQKTFLSGNQQTFLFLSTFLFLYITLFHTITAADERYSLPAYPVLIIFSAFGFKNIFDKIFRK